MADLSSISTTSVNNLSINDDSRPPFPVEIQWSMENWNTPSAKVVQRRNASLRLLWDRLHDQGQPLLRRRLLERAEPDRDLRQVGNAGQHPAIQFLHLLGGRYQGRNLQRFEKQHQQQLGNHAQHRRVRNRPRHHHVGL